MRALWFLVVLVMYAALQERGFYTRGWLFFSFSNPPLGNMVIAASIADETQSRTEKFRHLYAELLDSLDSSNSVEVL